MIDLGKVVFLILCTLILVLAYVYKKASKEEEFVLQKLASLYKTVKKPIEAKDEKNIQITEMWVYPVRQIRADCQVDYMDIGPYGPKYDREIILIDKEKNCFLYAYNYLPLTCLRQSLKGSKVEITTDEPSRLTAKGMPVSLTLEMDIDPKTELGEKVEITYKRWVFTGYKFPSDVNKWFSTAIEKEVFAIRAPIE